MDHNNALSLIIWFADMTWANLIGGSETIKLLIPMIIKLARCWAADFKCFSNFKNADCLVSCPTYFSRTFGQILSYFTTCPFLSKSKKFCCSDNRTAIKQRVDGDKQWYCAGNKLFDRFVMDGWLTLFHPKVLYRNMTITFLNSLLFDLRMKVALKNWLE